MARSTEPSSWDTFAERFNSGCSQRRSGDEMRPNPIRVAGRRSLLDHEPLPLLESCGVIGPARVRVCHKVLRRAACRDRQAVPARSVHRRLALLLLERCPPSSWLMDQGRHHHRFCVGCRTVSSDGHSGLARHAQAACLLDRKHVQSDRFRLLRTRGLAGDGNRHGAEQTGRRVAPMIFRQRRLCCLLARSENRRCCLSNERSLPSIHKHLLPLRGTDDSAVRSCASGKDYSAESSVPPDTIFTRPGPRPARQRSVGPRFARPASRTSCRLPEYKPPFAGDRIPPVSQSPPGHPPAHGRS